MTATAIFNVTAPAYSPSSAAGHLDDIAARLESGVTLTKRIDAEIATTYSERFRAKNGAVKRFIFDHPKLFSVGEALLSIGAFATGLGCVGDGVHNLYATGAGFLIPAAIGVGAFFACLVAADFCGWAAKQHATKDTIDPTPLQRHELAPLVTMLRGLPEDDRAVVRDYVNGWVDQTAGAGRIGPQGRMDVVSVVNAGAPQPIPAAALQLVRDAASNKDENDFGRRTEALLERTPPENRRDLAEALRKQLFTGDHCHVANMSNLVAAKLYEMLISYNVVIGASA